MTKQEAEKELAQIINYILNPYNEKEVETEAYLLAEVGWRKVQKAKWKFGGDGIVECSACEETYDNRTLPRNYCPNCGAEMIERKCFDDKSLINS
jgi:predicted RNA-binding Zn-ribbon protein involved in translation (DUF1610 family)